MRNFAFKRYTPRLKKTVASLLNEELLDAGLMFSFFSAILACKLTFGSGQGKLKSIVTNVTCIAEFSPQNMNINYFSFV